MGFFDERKEKLKNRSNLGANNPSVFLLIYYSRKLILALLISSYGQYIFLMEIGLRNNFSLKMSEI